MPKEHLTLGEWMHQTSNCNQLQFQFESLACALHGRMSCWGCPWGVYEAPMTTTCVGVYALIQKPSANMPKLAELPSGYVEVY